MHNMYGLITLEQEMNESPLMWGVDWEFKGKEKLSGAFITHVGAALAPVR